MSSPEEFAENELLKTAFASRQVSASNDMLRGKVLMQTTGVIRTRRRLKRLGIGSALVACYFAGILTTSFFPGSDSRPSEVESDQLIAKTPVVAPEHVGKTPDQIADEAAAAEAAKLSRYELLRRDGARCEQRGDLTAAIQSYKDALEVATPEERAVSVNDDTWLLMALKNDQS
jgi:hypothetical protein